MAAPSQYPQTMELPYRWADIEGCVRVELRVNDDPAALGCPELARGFPYCQATVKPLGKGYTDFFGWVQLVYLKNSSKSPLVMHSGKGFEIDPFLPIGLAPYPFTFFGLAPAFFDAPHTDEDWDFVAHSFLCGMGGELHDLRREARAILGFSWGFSKRGPEIEFVGLNALEAADWNGHRDYLAQTFREWKFALGFLERPLP